jgi:hypothetical protein
MNKHICRGSLAVTKTGLSAAGKMSRIGKIGVPMQLAKVKAEQTAQHSTVQKNHGIGKLRERRAGVTLCAHVARHGQQ